MEERYESSQGMLSREQFQQMKPTAHIVSISPDEIIVRDALAEALSEGYIKGAALDLLKADPFYIDLPNLLLSCRRAWYTEECISRRITRWRETLLSHIQKSPINLVV